MSVPLKELIERHAGGVRGTIVLQSYYSQYCVYVRMRVGVYTHVDVCTSRVCVSIRAHFYIMCSLHTNLCTNSIITSLYNF